MTDDVKTIQMDDGQLIINESDLSEDEIKQLESMGFQIAEQGSEEWLEERLGLVTASRIKDVVWRTRYGQPYAGYETYKLELAMERVTGQMKRFSNRYMDWGKKHEDDAADYYEGKTGHELATSGFIKCDDFDAGASPDRLVNNDGLLEIKCPDTTTHIKYMTQKDKEGNPTWPNEYYDQMQWQMRVTGRKWCDFMSFDPDMPENAQAFIIRVPRDDVYIKTMEERLAQFLKEVDELEQLIRDFQVGDTYGYFE